MQVGDGFFVDDEEHGRRFRGAANSAISWEAPLELDQKWSCHQRQRNDRTHSLKRSRPRIAVVHEQGQIASIEPRLKAVVSQSISDLRLAVTGERWFLDRYSGLAEALRSHFAHVDEVRSGNLGELLPIRVAYWIARKAFLEGVFQRPLKRLDRRAWGYRLRTKMTEGKLAKLTPEPDFVIHIFSSFAPFWHQRRMPFAMYLDFTMMLARREWPAWAEFPSINEFRKWVRYEGKSYHKAQMLFTMGESTKNSLIQDYEVDPRKIFVVGSSSQYTATEFRPRTFGSKTILFQGSEFERKGGDILLSAFRLVKKELPNTELIIVGTDAISSEAGVQVRGYVGPSDMQSLLQSVDLVVAPARCDPFSAFVIEAISHGIPTMVSKESGISAILKDGVNAIVIERLDPPTISNQILTTISDHEKLQTLSVGGRKLFEDRLAWPVVAKKIIEQINAFFFAPATR
jgi:glycogen synthase